MNFCTKPEHAHMPQHGHLSMPDPCTHITRLELIAARLNCSNAEDQAALETMLSHIEHCDGTDPNPLDDLPGHQGYYPN